MSQAAKLSIVGRHLSQMGLRSNNTLRGRSRILCKTFGTFFPSLPTTGKENKFPKILKSSTLGNVLCKHFGPSRRKRLGGGNSGKGGERGQSVLGQVS